MSRGGAAGPGLNESSTSRNFNGGYTPPAALQHFGRLVGSRNKNKRAVVKLPAKSSGFHGKGFVDLVQEIREEERTNVVVDCRRKQAMTGQGITPSMMKMPGESKFVAQIKFAR